MIFVLFVATSISYSMEGEKNFDNLKLNQCIEYALNHNQNIKTKKQKLKEALYGLKSVIKKNYPSFNIRTAYGYENYSYKFEISDNNDQELKNRENYDFYEITLSLTHDLYTWGRKKTEIEIAALSCDIEKLNLKSTIENLIYDITKAFYDIVFYNLQLSSIHEYLKILETDYDHIKQRFEIGDASKFELIMAKVKYREQEKVILSYQKKLKKEKLNILNLMGSKIDETLSFKKALHFLPDYRHNKIIQYPLSEAPDESFDDNTIFKDRTPVKLLSLQQKIVEKEISLERSSCKPLISGSIEYYTYDQNNILHGSDYQDNILTTIVSINIPLMEPIKAGPRIQEKFHLLQSLASEKTNTFRNFQMEAGKAFLDKNKGKEELAVVMDNISLLENAVKMVRDAYEAGSMSLLDVQQVTLSYITTEMQYNEIIHDLSIVDLMLSKTFGKLLTPDLLSAYEKMIHLNDKQTNIFN